MVEVMFAIMLTAVAAMVLAATIPVANRSRARADFSNKATSLAQKQIEAIKGLGYANCTADQLLSYNLIDSTTTIGANTYSFSNVDSTVLDNPARILPNGEGRLTIEQADLDLRRVVIEIRWVDRSVNKTFRLGTLIANL